MTSGSNPPEPCLAQQAMQAYDLLDEAQMLTFISRNADSHPTGFPRSEHALTVLNDHTAVLITDQQYIFLWHRTCSSGLFHPPAGSVPSSASRPTSTNAPSTWAAP